MDRNLEAFLAVARYLNLTEASVQIGLTQSSVTKRIANLEYDFGAKLFVRHRRGMTLTAAGQAFFARAKRIENEYQQCREEVKIIGSAGMSVVRFGAGTLFHLTYAAKLIGSLKLKFPNIRFELSTNIDNATSKMLSESVIDVYMGIITPENLDDSTSVKYVTNVEHGIVLRADDPNASKDRVDPSWLKDYNWVFFTVDHETEKKIEEYFIPKSVSQFIVDVRTTSFNAGLQLVRQGKYALSAPLQLAPEINDAGLIIRPTVHGMPRRKAGIHVRKSSIGYGVIQAIMEFFDDFNFET